MTVPKWDAKTFHETHRANDRREPRGQPRWKLITGLAVAVLLLGGAATAGTQSLLEEPQKIGICHATGSDAQPYVFLIVDKDGYEHGHHRHHEDDFFRDPEVGHCGDDEYLPPGAVGNDTADEAGDDGNETAEEFPVDEGADDSAGDGNDTADDGDATGEEGDQSDDGNDTVAGNETVDEGAQGNETSDGNDTADNETVPQGDAAVSQHADQDDMQVTLHLLVSNRGDGDASDVTLEDQLPDLRRPWSLGGDDASACILEGRSLQCWFGTLAPGEVREVSLHAYTDRMPCGESMTNTAWVSATDDADARNDGSSASITARYC